MSDHDLTPRMLWNAAQREADKGTDGSDLTFTRLLWMAQILAAIEVSEAATRAVRAEAAIARVREACGNEWDEGAGYMADEWARGRNFLRDEILNALDGGAE